MSKADGKKIGIKFTQPLLAISITGTAEQEKQDGNWTAYGTYSSSYPVDNIKDGSISSYWRTNVVGNYIQVERADTTLSGIKIYKGSSYKPSTYDIQVSDDGINYASIKTGSFLDVTGWETITLDERVETNYIRVYFTYGSSRLYVYEMVLLVMECDHQNSVGDFTITGQEYLYTDGPYNNGELVDEQYEVKKLSIHPTIPNAIILDIKNETPFNSVIGALTVNYKQSKGNLQGAGGAVASFEETFIPIELREQGNPRVREYIDADITGTEIKFIYITRINAEEQKEYIDANITGTKIELIYIDPSNP